MKNDFSRREFIKMGVGLGGTALLASAPSWAYAKGAFPFSKDDVDQLSEKKLVKGYCPFCQVRCTYHAEVVNGKAVNFIGDRGNKWTGGAMCSKGLSMLSLVSSPYRLTEPMVRTANGLEPISYQDALKLIVQKVHECREKRGAKAGNFMAQTAPLYDCRESEIAALMTMRFLGCNNIMPPGEVCISSTSVMLTSHLGTFNSTTTVDELVNADTIILWGSNISETYPPYTRWLDKAKEKGVKIILIDNRKSPTSAFADTQFMPLPGTDGALAIGALKYLIDTDNYDKDAVQNTTTGFERLQNDSQKYTIDFVAEQTKLTKEEILNLYKIIAQSKKTILWIGGCLARYTNGITTIRSLIAIQGIRNNFASSGQGLMTMEGGKPEGEEIFIDKYTDSLRGKGVNFRRLLGNMKKGNLDILFLNSSYRRYPDSVNVRKAIENCGFVIHRGFFMTEEVEVADLFLPATFSLESKGSHYGAEKQVVWRDKAQDAPGQCVPDWQFYKDLGMLLAPDKYYNFKDPEDLFVSFSKEVEGWHGITIEKVKNSPDGVIWPLNDPNEKERTGTIYPNAHYHTSDHKLPLNIELYNGYNWELPRGNPNGSKGNKDFPLVFTQGKVATHWQQTLTNVSEALAQITPYRYVQLNPKTAEKYSITQGEAIYLETEWGKLEAVAQITPTIIEDVIFTPSHYMNSSPYPTTKSVDVNAILPNYWDRISAQFNGIGCRVVKKS